MILLNAIADASAVTPAPGQADRTLFLTSINTLALKDQAGVVTPVSTGSVQSVAGKTGIVTLVKADVGLANVDNTTDVSKPVSTATQTALNAKQATLVSGTNIKTINGASVLGTGDIVITGGGAASATLQTTLTGAATLAATAIGNVTPYNSAANANLTVPTDATLALAANAASEFTLFVQSTGIPTFVGISGVTVNKAIDYPNPIQNSFVTIQRVAANTWAYK